mgnify:CR=1 FL=1
MSTYSYKPGSGSISAAGAYGFGGKLYSAKDTIDLTIGTAVPTDLVVRVSATFTRV